MDIPLDNKQKQWKPTEKQQENRKFGKNSDLNSIFEQYAVTRKKTEKQRPRANLPN